MFAQFSPKKRLQTLQFFGARPRRFAITKCLIDCPHRLALLILALILASWEQVPVQVRFGIPEQLVVQVVRTERTMHRRRNFRHLAQKRCSKGRLQVVQIEAVPLAQEERVAAPILEVTDNDVARFKLCDKVGIASLLDLRNTLADEAVLLCGGTWRFVWRVRHTTLYLTGAAFSEAAAKQGIMENILISAPSLRKANPLENDAESMSILWGGAPNLPARRCFSRSHKGIEDL